MTWEAYESFLWKIYDCTISILASFYAKEVLTALKQSYGPILWHNNQIEKVKISVRCYREMHPSWDLRVVSYFKYFGIPISYMYLYTLILLSKDTSFFIWKWRWSCACLRLWLPSKIVWFWWLLSINMCIGTIDKYKIFYHNMTYKIL